jgi:hypothetical protein
MPRLPELRKEDAEPSVREVMERQEEALGLVLNPTKLQGYCPPILEGAGALGAGINRSGQIEPALRFLVYTFVAGRNGCPF